MLFVEFIFLRVGIFNRIESRVGFVVSVEPRLNRPVRPHVRIFEIGRSAQKRMTVIHGFYHSRAKSYSLIYLFHILCGGSEHRVDIFIRIIVLTASSVPFEFAVEIRL